VRIPNATIFKEIMINATASPSFRNSFDVVIPNNASVVDAIEAINRALKELKGILADPLPRALVEALEPDGVRIRAYLWAPSQNADWFALLSEAKLRTNVALQQAGVIGAASVVPSQLASQTEATQKEAANQKRHAQAAAAARPHPDGNGATTPVDRVLEQPETRVSEEGANLLT
jgi:small-conductance mechanosensitive channel